MDFGAVLVATCLSTAIATTLMALLANYPCTTTLYPVIAPPLILVGTMMIGGLRHVAWEDPTESIPAFLTLIVMPLAVSITEGIAFGLIAFSDLKLVSGRAREVHPLIYVFALLFLARYAWLR